MTDSISVEEKPLDKCGRSKSESDLTEQRAKIWDTTQKVLGVNTVLGTVGITSGTLISAPSFGGVLGGCVTAGMGVATAASLVTGVGVIAGMGVAGVNYARKRSWASGDKENEEEKGQ